MLARIVKLMLPILLLLLALPGSSQTPARKKAAAAPAAPASQASFPLVLLAIKGNQIYSENQIWAASGLKLGQQVDNTIFEAARLRLMKTGAFENVSYQFGPDADNKGIAGTLAVMEVDQLYPYHFEDLPVKDSDLRAFLMKREPLFESKIPGTREFLDHFAAEIHEYTAVHGLKDKVVAKVVADGPGQLAIMFRPSTPLPMIGEVNFTGNQELSSRTLNNAFGLIAIGTPYREAKVRLLLESGIRPLYESRGRMRASFTKIESKKMEKVDGVSVAITVTEGPAYKLADIKASGSTLPSKDLVKAAELKTGELFNFDEVQSAVARVQTVFRKEGFMHSETHVDREIHDKELTVDIEFKSTEGPRFFMGALNIEGLDVTTEPAIKKLWSMTPGKVYNSDYPQFFLDRVKEDGYFDNLGRTWFDSQVNEKNHTVDVTLHFKGAPPELEHKKKQHGPGPGPSFWYPAMHAAPTVLLNSR